MDSTSNLFPSGLRVLAVDNDHTHLKHVERILKESNYKVTTADSARDALNILRDGKTHVNMVISDVNLRDMDGYRFLEYVGKKMNIPVVMMYLDGEASTVMKGVEHGVYVSLLKPVTKKELLNIWQPAEGSGVGGHGMESNDEIEKTRHGSAQYGDGEDAMFGKKRKEDDNRESSGRDSSSVQEPRYAWTPDLQEEFVKAVEQIGLDEARPKEIHDLMKAPGLKRKQVASHLQKFRLKAKRQQKEVEENAASGGGLNLKDISAHDYSGNLHLPSASVSMQHNMVMDVSHIFAGLDDIQPLSIDPAQCSEELLGYSIDDPTVDSAECSVQPQLPYFMNGPTVDPPHCSKENNQSLRNINVGNGLAARFSNQELIDDIQSYLLDPEDIES